MPQLGKLLFQTTISSRFRSADLHSNTAQYRPTNPARLAALQFPFCHLRALPRSNFFCDHGFRFSGGMLMTRSNRPGLVLAFLLLFAALPLLAQSSAGVPPPTGSAPGSTPPQSNVPGSNNAGNRGRGRQQPCWQVAGISQQTVQQHRQIEENTRSQVQSVCSNSSLSAQQKHEQIRQIHEQARKQMESLMTPQQEEALKSCREQRGGEHRGGGGAHRGGESPCGETPAGSGQRPNGNKPQPQNQSPSEPDNN
jgi:Spy/CpxP family protein refolding chaperone